MRPEPLSKRHDLSNFDCGVPALNIWLQTIANQHQAKLLSRTFVLTDEGTRAIMGYYALAMRGLSSASDLPEHLGKRLPFQIPAITLARLAVSVNAQGQGIGEQLLVDAMTRAKQVAMQIGGNLLFVDAKDMDAARFYLKYGFVPMPGDPLVLCIPIATIPA
ncbi:MAG: GNAT family N-acetyltransferase [Burkholderiaceae bacterium]|nr:GNAT family N-acetyltransferase [Burkholderiaceae bacterium]